MNWKHTIDIKDAWKKSEDSEMTPAELAAVIAEKLKTLPADLPSVQDQINEFIGLADETELTDDDFDDAFVELYGWADENSVWISTF